MVVSHGNKPPKAESNEQFSDEEATRRMNEVVKHMIETGPKPHSEMKIGKRKAKASQRDDTESEFRAWHDKVLAEEAEQFGPLLDAMLLEAQSLRLAEGHKARERTLLSLETVRMSQRRSQEAE